MKRRAQARMAEAKAGRQRLPRQHPLAAEKQFVGEISEGETKRRGGRGEDGRTVQGPPEGARQVGVGHRLGGDRIDRPREAGVRHGVEDEPNAVVERDPRHPLTSGAHRAAKAKLERGQQAGQHAAGGAEHEADAQGHHPHTEGPCPQGGLLPGVAEAVAEAGVGGAALVERPIAVQAVPTDGGAADQHLRPGLKPGDQASHVAGDLEARTENSPALGEGPQAVADRLSREVDDGVDAGGRGDLSEVADDRDRSRKVGGLRIPDQGDDLVARAGQGGDQAAADEARGAGDQHTSAAGEVPTHRGGVGRDQAVGSSGRGQIAQAEESDPRRGPGHHPAPRTVGHRDQPRRPCRPADQERDQQGQDGPVVQGQQGMGDALAGRQAAGSVFLDEVRQGDHHLDGQQDQDDDRQPALWFGPADQQEQGGVDQVSDPVQPQFRLLGRPPRQPLGQLVMEQGVEGPHGDLQGDEGPEQVGHVRSLRPGRPGRWRPGRAGGRTAGGRGRG
ncbi:hypothetical protein N0B44_07470 [Roseibacterium beibuensis]|nr:hypothetical protein [Roseibacterium beibuensis]MCS6622743.1 hypothetical protein [Roseibacterium beibuensis]